MTPPLDEVDRGILYELQCDAHQPVTEIARSIGVANNTVRNRVEKMVDAGIISRFTVDLDYGRADIQHHYLFLCTADVEDRERSADAAVDVSGIVRSTTLMTGRRNVLVEAVAPTRERLIDIAVRLDELGLVIEREHLVWSDRRRPYSGFAKDAST